MRRWIVLLLVAWVLGGCGIANAQAEASEWLRWTRQGDLHGVGAFDLVEVDGMPCVVFHAYKHGGITCDWSKWKGE